MIKVSACLITYNHEAFITECIEGALCQNLDYGYEIVIGDDCSSDRTSEICQSYALKYPDKIKYYRREQNLGMIGNWLATIKQCQGKYIALCEGDDYWTDPLKLQKQVDFLEKNEDYTLCFHEVNVLLPSGVFLNDSALEVPENYEDYSSLAINGNFIHTPSVVFKNILKEFPNEILQLAFVDYFLYLLLREKGKIKKIGDTMGVYRSGVGILSKSNTDDLLLKWLKQLYVLKYYFKSEDFNEQIDKTMEKWFQVKVNKKFDSFEYVAKNLQIGVLFKAFFYKLYSKSTRLFT